jgi:hypothetical protein
MMIAVECGVDSLVFSYSCNFIFALGLVYTQRAKVL